MDKIANLITDYCVKRNAITKDKKEIYSYGFKLIIADIINFILIMVLGMIFNRFLESIVFLISLCGVRRFTGGFHAKTFFVCRLSMIITFGIVGILSDVIRDRYYENIVVLMIFVNVVSVVFISIYAPVENSNKPLQKQQKQQKQINKIKSIITSSFFSTISIVLVIADIKIGVNISITLLAVVVLMIIGLAMKKGGKCDV